MSLPPRIAQHLPQIISSILTIIALVVGLATVSESSNFGSSFGSARHGDDSAKNTTVPVKTTSASPTSEASPTSSISKPTQDKPPASSTAPLLTPQTSEANPEPETSEISNKELQEVIDNLDLEKSSKIEFDEAQQRITISDHGSIKVANRRVSLKNQNAPLSITFDLSGEKRENKQLSELSAFGSVLAPMGVHAAPSDASSGVEISFTLPHAPSGSMNTGIIHFDEVLDYWTPEQTLTSTDGKTFTTTVNQLSAFSFGAFVDPSHSEYYKLDDAEVRQKNLETWNSTDSIIDNPSAVVTTDILKFLKDEKAIHFDRLNRFLHNDRANKYLGSELAIQDDARECAKAYVSVPDWIEPPSNQNFNLEIPYPPYWLCIDSSDHPEKLGLQYKLADLVPLQLAINGGRDVENDAEKNDFFEDYIDSSDLEYQAFPQALIKQAAANSMVFPTTEESSHLDKIPLVPGVKNTVTVGNSRQDINFAVILPEDSSAGHYIVTFPLLEIVSSEVLDILIQQSVDSSKIGRFLKSQFECWDGTARTANGIWGQSKHDLSLKIGFLGNAYNCLNKYENLIRDFGDPSILEGPKTKRILEKARFVDPLTTTAAVGVDLLAIQRKALVYSIITHHAEEIQQVHALNLSCDVSRNCIRGTVTSTTGESILDGAQAPDGSPSSKKYWVLRLNKPFIANVHKGPNSTIKEVSEIAFESEHWPSGQELDWSAYEGKELKIPNADKLEFWERQDTAMPIGYPRVRGLSDAKPEDAITNLNVILN